MPKSVTTSAPAMSSSTQEGPQFSGNARMKLSRKVMQIIARVGKTEL